MNQFQQLMQEMDAMAKSLPAGEGEGTPGGEGGAAGGEGGEGGGEGGGTPGGEGEGNGEGEGEGEGQPMAKSFEVTLPDGTKVQAQDAGEVLKSLNEQISAMGSDVSAALKSTTELLKKQGEVIVNQGAMIKSLSEQVQKLGGQGTGRKAVLTLTERRDVTQPMAKGGQQHDDGKKSLDAGEFLTKSMDAYNAGALTSFEVATIEASINRGMQPPAPIVEKFSRWLSKQTA